MGDEARLSDEALVSLRGRIAMTPRGTDADGWPLTVEECAGALDAAIDARAALAAKDEEIAALQRDRDEWHRVSNAMESARDAAWRRGDEMREVLGVRFGPEGDDLSTAEMARRVVADLAEHEGYERRVAEAVGHDPERCDEWGDVLERIAALRAERDALMAENADALLRLARDGEYLARLRAREERTAAVIEAALAWDESPGDHALCVALSDAVGRVRALDATPEHARGPSGVERRIEYRDIGLPHPVGYCSACGLPVDCLSGEDVCSCDVPRCGARCDHDSPCILPAGERRAIVDVTAYVGSHPFSEQPDGVEIHTDDGEFWLRFEHADHGDDQPCCRGPQWHVYRDPHLDTAELLSHWPTWIEAIEAIIWRREDTSAVRNRCSFAESRPGDARPDQRSDAAERDAYDALRRDRERRGGEPEYDPARVERDAAASMALASEERDAAEREGEEVGRG